MKQAIVVALLVSGAAQVWALDLGEAAPKSDVKMKSVDGKELSIADVKGEKGTLVVFSCQHCPFAKAWDSRIATLGNEYSGKDVGVIQINSNDPAVAGDTLEVMQQQAQAGGYKFPYVVDATSDIARAFGAGKTPEVFLFDASGKLVYHGAVDDNKSVSNVTQHYLKDALEALVNGKEITLKDTKAVGCSIKFRS